MALSLDDQLKRIRKEEAEVLSKINERNKKRTIECSSCKNFHKIGDLVLIQTHFYVSPSGCNEGDYWSLGEMRFNCPQTNVSNRILFNNNELDWEERKKYENDPEQQFRSIYGRLFKEVVEFYSGKDSERKWVNNFYVDRNREKFGLVKKGK